MAITDWPKEERPREKLLARGAEALSDAELLAIFLRTGIRGKTAVDLARELLNEFGSLSALLRADKRQFCRGAGLGEAKYSQLQAVLEMGRRYLYESLQRNDAISNTNATRQFLSARLCHYRHEVFACLFLDNRHQVIQFEELFSGTIDGTAVYPRVIVQKALQYNAAAVILSHNHPSGVKEPSLADRQITRRICDALNLVDIRVLDHVIVGDGEALSFAEKGLL